MCAAASAPPGWSPAGGGRRCTRGRCCPHLVIVIVVNTCLLLLLSTPACKKLKYSCLYLLAKKSNTDCKTELQELDNEEKTVPKQKENCSYDLKEFFDKSDEHLLDLEFSGGKEEHKVSQRCSLPLPHMIMKGAQLPTFQVVHMQENPNVGFFPLNAPLTACGVALVIFEYEYEIGNSLHSLLIVKVLDKYIMSSGTIFDLKVVHL